MSVKYKCYLLEPRKPADFGVITENAHAVGFISVKNEADAVRHIEDMLI